MAPLDRAPARPGGPCRADGRQANLPSPTWVGAPRRAPRSLSPSHRLNLCPVCRFPLNAGPSEALIVHAEERPDHSGQPQGADPAPVQQEPRPDALSWGARWPSPWPQPSGTAARVRPSATSTDPDRAEHRKHRRGDLAPGRAVSLADRRGAEGDPQPGLNTETSPRSALRPPSHHGRPGRPKGRPLPAKCPRAPRRPSGEIRQMGSSSQGLRVIPPNAVAGFTTSLRMCQKCQL